jgi:TolB-like protein
LSAAFFLCGAAWAGGFESLAKDLSRAARGSGIIRVAVIPFEPTDGSSTAEGWNISEKLITQIVRQGRLQAVERSFLSKLQEEHSLGRSGILDASTLRAVGKVFGVDGVITGSFVTMGSEALLNARFIDIETGVVLAAKECKVDREWTDPFGYRTEAVESAEESFDVPIPARAPPPHSQDRLAAERGLQDAPSDDGCANAAERVDRMENSILDLKARYWALRLRWGASLSASQAFPGADISDLELRQMLYDRMRDWYAQSRIPELSPGELHRLATQERRARLLHSGCLKQEDG